MSKTQVGGNHYMELGISPFEYSMSNGLDAMQHTTIKYVTRFRDKNGIEDLEKAKDTIQQLIDYENLRAAAKDITDEAFNQNLPYKEALANLISKLSELDHTDASIVILPRGGLSPAHVIAEHFGIKDVKTYQPGTKYAGKILLVEDIIDQGDTLIEVLGNTTDFSEAAVCVAAVYERYSSKVKGDYIGTMVTHDDYITMPWEVKQ